MTNTTLPLKNIFQSEVAQAYIELYAKEPHPYLEKIREDCTNHKWHFMLTSKQQASFLHLLAKTSSAQKILEVGSFFGHSTLALASALPTTGELITIEHNPKFARKTREHLDSSGCGERVHILVGEAQDMLAKVKNSHKPESFDLFFLDADKRHYSIYWEAALGLIRSGGLVIVDNTLARGAVYADVAEQPGHVVAVQKFNDMVLKDPRVFSFIASISDGMLVAIKL